MERSPARLHVSQSVSNSLENWFCDEQTKQKDLTTKAKKAKISDSKAPPKKNRLFSLSATPQKLRRKLSQKSQNETQLAHPQNKVVALQKSRGLLNQTYMPAKISKWEYRGAVVDLL